MEGGLLYGEPEAVDAEGVSAADAPESTGEAPPVEPVEEEGKEGGATDAEVPSDSEARQTSDSDAGGSPQEGTPAEPAPAEETEPSGDPESAPQTESGGDADQE